MMIPLFTITITLSICLITSSILKDINCDILCSSKNAFITSSLNSFEKYLHLDNSANCHVLNNRSIFDRDITPYEFDLMIGTISNSTRLRGIRNVVIKERDNSRNLYIKKLFNMNYHLNSSVNIYSTSKLAIDSNNLEGTLIHSFMYYSLF